MPRQACTTAGDRALFGRIVQSLAASNSRVAAVKLTAQRAVAVRQLEEQVMVRKVSSGAVSVAGLVVFAALASVTSAESTQSTATIEAAAAPGDVLIGEWWTENNEGRVRFTKDRDGSFRGTTTCCIPKVVTADRLAQDIHNPNPTLRGRSTVGMVIIWKLIYDDGEYTGGHVYNPRDGKSYRIQAKVIDRDTIKIRGYVGIPLLGQSQIWKRVRTQPQPGQAAR